MLDYTRYVGLDVHKDSIAVCVVTADGEELPTSIIANDPDVIAKTMRRIARQAGGLGAVRCCYEAGPCGYTLYRQLTGMGVSCNVVAPGLTPVRPGNRVKTDRRDAKKLGRLERAGELTAVWVPDEAHEALRDLVRAREDAKEDLLRAGHRLSKFLLRHGKRPSDPMKRWTQKYERWLDSVHFEDGMQEIVLAEYRQQVREAREAMLRLERQIELAVQRTPFRATVMALQALRGVALIVSATLVSEYGDMTRFTHPRQMMSYAGLTPSEASSGQTVRRGGITKMGNRHIRRVLVEAAWCYRHTPRVGRELERRQQGQSPQIKSISWKAQVRLNQRYRWLIGRGKTRNEAVVAVARELVGFVWEVAWAVQGESLA
jgi:transposase